MKTRKTFAVALVLALLAVLSGMVAISISASYPDLDEAQHNPEQSTEALTTDVAQSSAARQTIIIDHTCTDLSQIPEHWIEAARELAIHYAHTSHGGQVRGLPAQPGSRRPAVRFFGILRRRQPSHVTFRL